MILEIIGALFLVGVAAAFIEDVIIPWAQRVINSVANAVNSVLYAIKDVVHAVFTVYVEDSRGRITEGVKKVDLNELPSDVLKDLRSGEKIKIGVGS